MLRQAAHSWRNAVSADAQTLLLWRASTHLQGEQALPLGAQVHKQQQVGAVNQVAAP